MRLRTVVGVIELQIWHGQDRLDKHWGSPIRERWGLKAHQRMSPALEEKLVFTATLTGSYEQAGLVAQKWSEVVDGAVIHQLVQRVGEKAEAQTQARLKEVAVESQPQRARSELAVVEMDGWLARFRGPGWGKKRTQKERVGWHEIKTGVFYCQEQAGRTAGGRPVLSEKILVRWQGEGGELARRLHWEGLRGGLGRAQEVLVLGDGSAWIWNTAQDRWSTAHQALDFYHASQHVWTLGRAYCGEPEARSKEWVQRRLHQLRHGQEKKVLQEIARLKLRRGQASQTVRKEQNYFAGQAGRMNYQELSERGWPIGSGAVESACKQSQVRFKRCGQFWTQAGLRHLSALDEARRNGHWDELWLAA